MRNAYHLAVNDPKQLVRILRIIENDESLQIQLRKQFAAKESQTRSSNLFLDNSDDEEFFHKQ